MGGSSIKTLGTKEPLGEHGTWWIAVVMSRRKIVLYIDAVQHRLAQCDDPPLLASAGGSQAAVFLGFGLIVFVGRLTGSLAVRVGWGLSGRNRSFAPSSQSSFVLPNNSFQLCENARNNVYIWPA
jgi:hypothetical protein